MPARGGKLITEGGSTLFHIPTCWRAIAIGAIVIAVFLCGRVGPVWAFSGCAVRALDPGPANVARDGQDPVAADGHIYMAYTKGNDLVFLSSTDGVNFTTQRLNDATEITPFLPRIATRGSRVYVVWMTNDGWEQVVFRASGDYGATFGPRISLGAALAAPEPLNAQIAVRGLGITVIYVDPAFHTTLVSSSDGGVTWPYMPSWTIPGLQGSEVWVARLGKHIVGAGSEVDPADPTHLRYTYVGTSADSGADYTVTELTGPLGAQERQVAVSDTTGYWYIYAQDEQAKTPSYGVLWTSKDAGSSWSRQVVSSHTPEGTMLVDGSTIYLTSQQRLPDGMHIYLIYSLDDGQTWAAPIDVSGPTGYPTPEPDMVYDPQISRYGPLFSEAYVSQGSVMVRSSRDVTKGLSAPITLGPGTNVSIAGGNVLWLGPGVGENQAVFFAHCLGG